MFSKGDGKHTLRVSQEHIRKELAKHWNDYDIFVISLLTGGGKSLIARMVQMEFPELKTAVITPQNNYIRQYLDDYNELNGVMGKREYFCESPAYSEGEEEKKFTCEDVWNLNHGQYCTTCSYSNARMREYKKEDTVYNVYSYFACTSKKGRVADGRVADIVVLDEADACLELIQDFASLSIPLRKFPLDTEKLDNAEEMGDFLREIGTHYERSAKSEEDLEKKSKLDEKAGKFYEVAYMLEQDWEFYALEIVKTKRSETLIIKPMEVPTSVLKRLTGKQKTLLMSASIVKEDLEALEEQGYRILEIEADTSIPLERRRVITLPDYFMGIKSRELPPEMIAQAIKDLLYKVKESHALVHTTYGDSAKLAKALTEAGVKYRTHTQLDKRLVLDEWKKKGGLLLGAGCDTGLNLKDNYCRLNIITKLRFPSLGSSWVKKRKAWKNGERWYLLQAYKFLIQAVGRGVRHEKDWCLTVVLDKNIGWLLRTLQRDHGVTIPKAFLDSIVYYGDDETVQEYLNNFQKGAK